MRDGVIECWLPEPRFARIPIQLGALAPTAVMLTVIIAFFALATRSLFPIALTIFVVLVWLMTRGPRSRDRHLLTQEVAFELTHDVIRVRFGDRTREVPLADVDAIRVVPTSKLNDIGHVVVLRRGSEATEPSIPTGRRVSGGTTGLVTWLKVEHVDPADQVFEGALTLWFVAHPKHVCARLNAAVRGVSPHSQGPHR